MTQPLSDADVRYLLGSVSDAMIKAETQLRSVAKYYMDKGQAELANQVQIAVSNAMSAGSHARIVHRTHTGASMPHRLNDGEDPAW